MVFKISNLQLLLKCFTSRTTICRVYSIKFDIVNLPNGRTLHRPKKPINSFILFCQEVKQKMKEELEESKEEIINERELRKICGEKWLKISSIEKLNYETLYSKNFEEYLVQRTLFYNKLSKEDRSLLKKYMQKRVEFRRQKIEKIRFKELQIKNNKPKQPLRPFFAFLNTKTRPKEVGRTSLKSWMMEVGNEFKHLSKDEICYYQKEYEKQYADYIKKLNQWEDDMIKNGKPELLDKEKQLDIKPIEIDLSVNNDTVTEFDNLAVLKRMSQSWHELYSQYNISVTKKYLESFYKFLVTKKSITSEWITSLQEIKENEGFQKSKISGARRCRKHK